MWGLRPDPSPVLEASFRASTVRMAGLAFVNPALEVEAIGFAPWNGHWLGVLLTPWCMNLVLMPRDPALWTSLAIGAKRSHGFPAGDYDFIGAHHDSIGDFQMCSLFSPVSEFADQSTARLVATLAREALFDPANAEPPADHAGSPPSPGPIAKIERQLDAPLSKRDLLHGRLGRRDHDTRR